MKTHNPIRTPLPQPEGNRRSNRQTATIVTRKRRPILLILVTSGLVVSLILNVALICQHVELNGAFYDTLDDFLETSEKVRKVSQELEQKDAELKRLQEEMDQAKGDLSDSKSALEESQGQTNHIIADRDVLITQLNALQAIRDTTHAELRSIQQAHLNSLIMTGRLLFGDPMLSRRTLADAVAFADSAELDADAARKLAAQLQAPHSIPENATVRVVTFRKDANAFVADVEVLDAGGHFIPALGRADFEVSAGDQRLHLVAVGTANHSDQAHTIAVVLDTSGSTKGEPSEKMKAAAVEFAATIANPSRLRVYRFSDSVTAISPLSIDATLHTSAIKKLDADGGTALYLALRVASEDLYSESGVLSIVLFTDGSDSFNDEDIEKTLAACREHAISVHVLMLATAEVNEPILRRIAGQTNGMFLSASDPARLSQEFAAVTAAFQRPVYRVAIFEPVDEGSLTLQVGTLPAVSLKLAAGDTTKPAGT